MTGPEHAAQAELLLGTTPVVVPAPERLRFAEAHAVLAVYRELADLRAVLGGVRDELARGLR